MSLDRRRFFASASAAALAAGAGSPTPSAAAETSARPTADELQAAADRPVLDLSGLDEPVIIESLRLLEKDGEYFVHVLSTDCAEGLCCTIWRAEYLWPICEQLVFPFFLGKDARKLESELLFGLYRHSSNYKLQGIALWCPQAWVEAALLDLLGRVAEKPVVDLLGGKKRDEIPFYVASGNRDTTPEEEVDYLQSLIDETGARAVKYRVGGRMSRNKDSMPGRTDELIPLSRKALGDAIDIHADSNSSYDPPRAIEVGRMLEEIDAVYFEEPCPFDHLFDTKEVTDALDIPVALGEQEFSERRFRWIIERRMADIVQPDLQYYGGLIRSLRVAHMADVAGMPTTVHISGGFGFVYMLIFAAAVKDPGKYQEYKRGIDRYNPWFETPIEERDGKFTVPSGVGVGFRDIAEVIRGAKTIVG